MGDESAQAVRVQDSGQPGATGVKRFYLPGVRVTAACPRCGAEVTRDYGVDYLTYPKVNQPFIDWLSHEDEQGGEHAFRVHLKLVVKLESVPPAEQVEG